MKVFDMWEVKIVSGQIFMTGFCLLINLVICFEAILMQLLATALVKFELNLRQPRMSKLFLAMKRF